MTEAITKLITPKIQQSDQQLIQYEKQFGEVMQAGYQEDSGIKRKIVIDDTNKMKEALYFDQKLNEGKNKINDDKESVYVKTEEDIDNMHQFKHKNPAHLKVYKNKKNQSKYSEKQNLSRISMEVKKKDQFQHVQRLSLPLRTNTKYLNKKISYNSPSNIKQKSVERKIICPTCKTKVTTLILNSQHSRSPSPKILRQHKSPKISPEKLSKIQNLKNIQKILKYTIKQKLEIFKSQIAQFTIYLNKNQQLIEQKLKASQYQINERQQKLFKLEIDNIACTQYIKKLEAEIKQVKYQNMIMTKELNTLLQTPVKKRQEEQGNSQKGRQIKRKDEDQLYENRMQTFNDRTEYTKKVLLKKGHKKYDEVQSFSQRCPGTNSSKNSSHSKDRTSTKHLSSKDSIVKSELQLLESLLESRLAYNY